MTRNRRFAKRASAGCRAHERRRIPPPGATRPARRIPPARGAQTPRAGPVAQRAAPRHLAVPPTRAPHPRRGAPARVRRCPDPRRERPRAGWAHRRHLQYPGGRGHRVGSAPGPRGRRPGGAGQDSERESQTSRGAVGGRVARGLVICRRPVSGPSGRARAVSGARSSLNLHRPFPGRQAAPGGGAIFSSGQVGAATSPDLRGGPRHHPATAMPP